MDLLDRIKSGRYKAPAVRRSLHPQGGRLANGPLGIPTFEDNGGAAGDAMVARGRLRAGLSSVLAWLSDPGDRRMRRCACC